MTENKNLFASNLKYLRLKNDMEQLELAKLLDRKSASTISEWESGKYTPKFPVIEKIAKIFSVDIDALSKVDLSDNYGYKSNQSSASPILMISEKLNFENYNQLIDYGQKLLEDQEESNDKDEDQ
ncbi:helix-turn-helix domain-containing protein [Streptococcus catagoni]|uniref:helix-turn-helix domain-containing protein n=1 Tax=Streptococcus catagoni TaxID=2654874 RepID=UPI001408FA2F|nr:helix-turn-helix transcriptional regulator [Streptococcus catagoni]